MKLKNLVLLGTVALGLFAAAEKTEAASTSDLKDVDIEVKYDRDEIEIEYKVENRGKVKAKYKNEITGEKFKGERAEIKIKQLMEKVDFSSKDQQAITKAVTSALNTGQDYTKFKFETEFTNRAKFKFEIVPSKPTPPQQVHLKRFQYKFKYGKGSHGSDVKIDYKVKNNRVEAEIDNELTSTTIKGVTAQQLVEQAINGLDLQTASQAEIESALMRVLGLTQNSDRVDGKIEFSNKQTRYFN